MAAHWSALTSYLQRQAGDRVHVSWQELADIVGGMPASAVNHPAWWSGDRPHVRSWMSAGFEVESKRPGVSVTFHRSSAASRPSPSCASDPVVREGSRRRDPGINDTDLLLVTCVKSKASKPMAAKDLYTSALFQKQRAYAERLGVPWFILSAEHALVAPEEWLSPYERYLPDTTASYRAAWGAWVVERLVMLTGELRGKTIEIHASREYVDAVAGHLRQRGAVVLTPLDGLSLGERLQWYGGEAHGPADVTDRSHTDDMDGLVGALTDRSVAQAPADFLARDRAELQQPGLYSWWVDEEGAGELSLGLGETVEPGLIYAGLAGATRWPSGKRSTNTLWERVAGMHLGSKHEFSTFRLTLGSVLAAANGWARIDEKALTQWMHRHLEVIARPYPDADVLGHAESELLGELDPPLNLQGMAPSPIRAKLSALRSRYSNRSRSQRGDA